MNRVLSIASAALLCVAGASALASPTLAANYAQRDQFIGNFCDSHPGANQCDDWRHNHNHWRDSDYQSFYRFHQRDFGSNVAAGIFGFAVGAALANAANNAQASNDSGHIAACQNAYRSYSVTSDTYLGYDGARHQCTL